MQDESGRVLKARWKSLKDSAKTVWDAMPGTSDAATAAAARQKIGDGLVGAFEALGTLAGPPPEAIQGAYLSGNPDAIALIEGMQARQQQAVGAVIDHVKQLVVDANARNGAAGASAMMLTTLGVEVLGGKGLGALGKVAGRISDIVRLTKSPLEAAMVLEKEIIAAKVAGRSADEITLLEKARDERLALARKDAAKPDESNGGVHVKKGSLSPNAESEIKGSKYTTSENTIGQTGARSLSVEEMWRQEAAALRSYDDIRASTTDVQSIVGNTGLKDFQVERVKNHLFYDDTHQLRASVGRFDPDFEIGQAWQRMESGQHLPQDIQLFKHEYFESRFEKIFKTDYGTAHNKTQLRYPSPLD